MKFSILILALGICLLAEQTIACVKALGCNSSNKVYHHGDVDIQRAKDNMENALKVVNRTRYGGQLPQTPKSKNTEVRQHVFENGRNGNVNTGDLRNFDQAEDALIHATENTEVRQHVFENGRNVKVTSEELRDFDQAEDALIHATEK